MVFRVFIYSINPVFKQAMGDFLILQEAIQAYQSNSNSRPASGDMVTALLEAEKSARKNKSSGTFESLFGSWQLCFITGTKKTRQKAGVVLGTGRYLPKFVEIILSYSAIPESERVSDVQMGTVENCVKLGALQLILSGPTKFLPRQNILAFDFLHLNLKFLGKTIYQGFIRGGEKAQKNFYAESVRKQAFFVYFYVQENAIAARGRGGGLALWGKKIP